MADNKEVNVNLEKILKGDQDSPMSQQELDSIVTANCKEREESDNRRVKSLEEHARCALLPSPEKLDTSMISPGADTTATLDDFKRVKEWVEKEELHNMIDNINPEEELEDSSFYGLVQFAFNTAFDAMRDTKSPELSELVFWYYAGHGLSKQNAENLCYYSTPCLNKIDGYSTHRDADDGWMPAFVKEERKVQGGELFLHKVGFCDLYGLLKPFIAAVKSDSSTARGKQKKNKHLVIILDSCYSGIIAQELNEFKRQTEEIHPLFLKENSVTIQGACGPDECTLGGYFTPCFVYLNDRKNGNLLEALKAEWESMTDEERDEYNSIELPSPMVVTTKDQSQDVTMDMEVQNFKLTLFQNPGFFKFCSIKVYQSEDNDMMTGKERVLNLSTASTFMKSQNFTVLDYKLKTYQGTRPDDPYTGTPMGLFLLDDPNNPNLAVCAHIHFDASASSAQKIKLVHHLKPPLGILYVEDRARLSHAQTSSGQHKKTVAPADSDAQKFVQVCRQYVESKEPDRWNDVSQWKMTGKQLGVNGMFRWKKRSSWEDEYLEYIKKFDLPKVVNS